MDNNPENKIITIIGNAGGTTQEIAENFLKKGAKLVILSDNDESWGNKTIELLNNRYGHQKSVFVVCEIASDLQVIPFATYQKYGAFDAIILNFGIIEETDRRKAVDFNLYWPIEYALKYWRYVRKDKEFRNGGTVIFVSSSCAFKENYFLPNYQAAAFALVGFTKSLGNIYNYNRTGVRVLNLSRDFTEQEIKSDPKVMYPEPSDDYQKGFEAYLDRQVIPKENIIGKAVIDLFEKGESGTTWIITDGNIKQQFFL